MTSEDTEKAIIALTFTTSMQAHRIVRIERTLLAIYEALPVFIKEIVSRSKAGPELASMRKDLES